MKETICEGCGGAGLVVTEQPRNGQPGEIRTHHDCNGTGYVPVPTFLDRILSVFDGRRNR